MIILPKLGIITIQEPVINPWRFYPGWPWPFECHPRAEVCTASSAVRDKGGRGSPRANSGPGRHWLQNLKVISGYQTLLVE
jgi:hypothetical protein